MSLESHFLSYKRWTSVSDNFHFVTSSVVICSSMGFQEDLMPSQSLRDKVHCCPPPADSWKPHIHSLRFVVFGFCRKVWWILYWSYSFNYSQALPFLFLVPPPILAAPPVLSKLFFDIFLLLKIQVFNTMYFDCSFPLPLPQLNPSPLPPKSTPFLSLPRKQTGT